MKKTVDAVRYGIETLGLTPEEFFSLIESSKDYQGADYGRWLASKVIDIAEEDGVGYSQLLVKKFAITLALEKDADVTLRKEWVDYINLALNSSNILTVDVDNLGTPLEGIDWYNGIDYSEAISSFVLGEGVLPEDVKDCIANDKEICFLVKLSEDSADKSSDLYQTCKSEGIVVKSEGMLMLYRMISIVRAFNNGKNFKFAFFADTKDLCSAENQPMIREFLKYFHCTGFSSKSTDLYEGSYLNTRFAFVICEPRTAEGIQECISLQEDSFVDGEIIKGAVKRYSKSSNKALDYLRSTAPKLAVRVNGMRNDKVCEDNLVAGYKDALGYLNFKQSKLWVSNYPDIDTDSYIAITTDNLMNVIVYFGVVKSLAHAGLPTEITKIMNGHEDYSKLVANCIPLFLYHPDNKVRFIEGVNSDLDSQSDFVADLLESNEVYFTYESKELLEIARGYVKYLDSLSIPMKGLSFEDARREADNEDLNREYLQTLINAYDMVKTLYRGIENE